MFLAAKYCVPHMAEGVQPDQHLVDRRQKRPRPGLTPYNASKGAVNTLTRGLAAELAPRIRVNAVCPVSAPTGFDMNAVGVAELPEAANRGRDRRHSQWGGGQRPADVADAIFYLASDQAAFMTGVCLDVDGGRSIQ